jgi:REP element-mobilizing transposase RayT
MARKPREESLTGYYHAMLRGINREFIFKRDSDKKIFLDLVKEQQEENLFQLAAWCIMDNHVHMIIKADIGSMSKAIKVISLKFAARYNKAQQRTGPVFGDRYRSECIEDDAYLLGAIRYIHLNPVQAGIVSSPSLYPWSSYDEYMNEARYINKHQRLTTLEMFGGKVQSFAEFHARPDDTEYLETREDLEKYRMTVASRVLEESCSEKGIVSAREIHANPELFAEISMRLIQGTKLSLRQAAELLETTHGRVHQAVQDSR